MTQGIRGFSLLETVAAVGLISFAIMLLANVSLQFGRVTEHSDEELRLQTTVENFATDVRAAIRYEGPTAQSLRAGLFPGTFTLYQWEPDLTHAPIRCTAEHVITGVDALHIDCVDRHGSHIHHDITLDQSQPYPAAVVTASPG
jgi:type II secretory pathway pseudopilin PulG